MADRLVRLGAPDSRIETLPLPVDVDAFARVAPTTPGPEETLRILSCGRLLPVKGMEVLLHAAASLGGSRSIEVSIAGDGPERARLKELARQLGLGESVRFLGWVEHRELPALMARAHLFVLASRRDPVSGQIEGTPTVLLEAQAAGLPVVSTRHGDIPSIVPEEARTHALVPEGEQAALAAAIARICDQPDLWRALGRAGRAFVTRRHAKHRVVERLERVYDDCLALRQATATPPG